MKLYHSPTSPYVRKVLVLLAETGQSGAVELVATAGTPVDPGTMPLAQNPLGKIPALERPEGPALYDSRVICRYLDTLHGGRRLYPEGPGLISTLTLEALADGALDAGVLALYEGRLRPEAARYAPWVEGQRAKMVRALDALEAQWAAHLAGPMDAGAIAVGCMLGWFDFRFADLDWRAGRPRLAAWEAEVAARDSFRETVPREA